MRSYFVLLLFTFIFFLSCSSSETTNVLINDIWALESIGGEVYTRDEGEMQHPIIEIHLRDERLFGNTGCNDMHGSVKVEGSSIKFSEIVTTKMACPGDNELKFLFALGEVNKYKIEKLKLYLFDDDKELLVFKKID